LKEQTPLEIPLVRIGGPNDGGYLIPENLPLPSAVFSHGVNDSDSFEFYFAKKGVPCFLADYSVERNPNPHENLHFKKKFISIGGPECISIEDWIKESVDSKISGMCLQMDIEGWEYHNLINISRETLLRFDSLCIEFHGFSRVGFWFDIFDEIFQKILRDFVPVHVHANNCCGCEIIHDFVLPTALETTFIKRNHQIIRNISTKVRDFTIHSILLMTITNLIYY
jgi:hypothetical protein